MDELPHLRLVDTTQSTPYTYAGPTGGSKFKLPPRDPSKHAAKLRQQIEAAQDEVRRHRSVLERRSEGFTLTFESDPKYDLKLESLENRRAGITLVSVRTVDEVTRGQVFVPEEKLSHFLNTLDKYARAVVISVECGAVFRDTLEALGSDDVNVKIGVSKHPDIIRATITATPSAQEQVTAAVEKFTSVRNVTRKNAPLIESISSIRLAVVEDFWEEPFPLPARDEPIWWEVWLHGERNSANRRFSQFRELAVRCGLRVTERMIAFPERIVALAFGSPLQISSSIDLLAMLAELRKAKELASSYLMFSPRDQKAFADDLLQRVIPPPREAPAVLILDSGVNRGHRLLSLALEESDTQAVNSAWGTADHDDEQHGTGMAGTALYGCLSEAFSRGDRLSLQHRLESVKVLPPPPKENEPELYGSITAAAIALAEIQNPQRNRAICMAITADAFDRGLPTSWSGAVDELCSGTLDDNRRLMFISAGNVRGELFSRDYRYFEWNIKNAGVEDPGQAWNAVTVGAYTEKVVIQDPVLKRYQPLASRGDLCPTSRTSLAWPEDHYGWPIKPDIVLEGGNYAEDSSGFRTCHEDLSLLTTILHPSGRMLEPTRDTSPATAQAARIAAMIWARYPRLWPETVRGLLIHSATWTPAMQARFEGDQKSSVQKRLRCFGYGVPNLGRALFCLHNTATLLYEGELQPFCRDDSAVKTHEMHLHSLPWPKRFLEELADLPVKMRVTLSYFIEPSPGRVGWGRMHRYQSHGLRFDVIRPLETLKAFRKRLSRAEWEEPRDSNSRPRSTQETRNWVVGEKGRCHGSIHSDWWEGTAAELSACEHIAVYPVTGWWRERHHLDRVSRTARYALIVSIETPREEIDLYTQVKNSAQVMTEVLASEG